MSSGHASLVPQTSPTSQSAPTKAAQPAPSVTAAPPDLHKMLAASQAPEDESESLQPLAVGTPKIKGNKQRLSHSAPQLDPTVDDILAPQEPAFDKANTNVLHGSIVRVVTDLYDKVLGTELQTLKTDLGKTKAPPPTPFAERLLGFVVEEIATWALGSIGESFQKKSLEVNPLRQRSQRHSRPNELPARSPRNSANNKPRTRPMLSALWRRRKL